MQTTSVSNLKAKLSDYLEKVKRGDDILVTEHGRPIARVTSVGLEDNKEAGKGSMDDLIRAGAMKPRKGPLPKTLLNLPPARETKGSALHALQEERDCNR